MEALKRELLLICRQRDNGREDLQGEWVEEFFSALKEVLTVQAIESFDVEQLRTAYVAFMCEVSVSGLENAWASLKYFFHATTVRRSQAVKTPCGPNVFQLHK